MKNPSARKPRQLANQQLTGTQTNITPQRVRRSLQARYNPIAALTPAYLTTTLDLFAQGYLGQFARLADAIEKRDDKVAACRRKRLSAIARYGFEILTADTGDDAQLAATAEQHKEVLEYFYNNVTACNAMDENQRGGFSLLVRQMADAIGKRYAVHEIVLQPGSGAEDGGLTAELRYCPLWFFENRTGRLRFLPDDTAFEGTDMDPEQWLVTVGDGIMEACAVAYMFKRLPLQDWLTYTEKFGMPGVLGETPAAPGSTQWTAMQDAVGAFMNDWAAVVNQGAKISLVETGTTGQLPFEALVERMDRAIAILWRGADLSTMSAGAGQGQGASVQADESDVLEQDDAAWLSETLQMQLSRMVIKYHFGEVRPLAYIKIKTRDDRDTKLDLEVLKGARELGIPVGIKDARERLSLPTPDKDDELLSAPAAPVDPATPPPAKVPPALANERPAGADDPAVGKLLAAARESFLKETAADLQPLRMALSEVLQGGDEASTLRRARQLYAVLPRLGEQIIAAQGNAAALYRILSAAAAEQLSTP